MPTITINSPDFKGTFLNSGNGNTNWGGFSGMYYGNSGGYRPIWKIPSSLIPAGTITAMRVHLHDNAGVSPGTILAYKIKPANVWNQGNLGGSDATGTGFCTWDFAQDNGGGVITWAGANGCTLSGTDYFADASPPSLTVTPGVFNVWSLPVAWAMDWKSNPSGNNGVIIDPNGSAQSFFDSPAAGSNQPFVEIDYTPTVNRFAFFKMI